MTKFGKTLVMLDVAFSVGLLAWAISLYVDRTDWTDQKAQGDRPAGELSKRQTRIDSLWKELPIAEAAWRDRHGAVAGLEKGRPIARAAYAIELQLARTGNRPLRRAVRVQGLPVVDADGFRPRMEPAKDRKDQPLQSLATYENELTTARDQLRVELKKYTDFVNEDSRLTLLLVGTPTEKGLRQRIIDERNKHQDVMKEQELTKPMLINAYVESQLILKRTESLKARIDELEHVRALGAAVIK